MGACFVDHYEVLRVSPNADPDTIDRIFRHLAKRFHPDNPGTGDADQFHRLVEAHRVLSDASERAAYDVRYHEQRVGHWSLAQEASDGGAMDDSRVLRARLLALLYSQRRRDVRNASLGNVELERLLACPAELLEFHLWYLKEKALVERTDKGFAITALGIDQAEASRSSQRPERLLTEGSAGGRD